MSRWLAAALVLFFAHGAMAQPKLDAKFTESVATPLPPGAVARPVSLTRVGSRLRDDQEVGTRWYGTICISPSTVRWSDVSEGLISLKEIFGEELKTAGFKPDADPGNLFADAQNSGSDLQLGAMIKSADVSFCDSLIGITGKLTLGVQWQVYSSLRREVVATVETSATSQKARNSGKEPRSLSQKAFAGNVRELLSNEQFRQIVTASDPSGSSLPTPGAAPQKIQFRAGPRDGVSMAQASGSVVAIFAGGGHGSGVLVGAEGYILTNAHVVGDGKTVRVRWSDGFETSGEVLRSDKRRDVALIRTEPRGRTPLAINRVTPPIGAAVFAIGTPLEPVLQNTVTRGVVSAARIIDGFNFIQSDTPVTFGNSGGPLLDEKGAVVGLTSSGRAPSEGSTLNFFIPIGDALDFLALEPAL